MRKPYLFRVVVFLPCCMPCVTVRGARTFRRAWDLYRRIGDGARTHRGRVQVQHAVPEIVRYDPNEGWITRLVWHVVTDTARLGNVRAVANPGARR